MGRSRSFGRRRASARWSGAAGSRPGSGARGGRKSPRLSDIGGIVALLVLMGFAAGYYLVPSAANLAPALLGLAMPEEPAIHRSFAICGGGPRVDCVIDGDTFYLDGEKIRIADINTPELFSPACGREAALAERAQHRLHQLLNAGPIELRRPWDRDRDAYGRKLRTVRRDGRSLGETLVAEGLAHRWRGYKESWCG